MKVPLTLRDHLDRALAVYPDRTAFVDEPDQPAPSMGEITFSHLGELADATGAGLDALGVGMGGRVAMVSHNAGRLLTCFWGVSGNGRIFVPINFRLSLDEVSYIVEHCGADVLLVDPELAGVLGPISCRHKFVLGEASDEAMFRFGDTPQPWTPDEDGTAVINYTSGTTARPKGVQQTHRSLWLNAAMFGWQASVSDRDTYLHTLPMFHCNGWGMPTPSSAWVRSRSCCAKWTAPRSCAGWTSTASPSCAGRRRWWRPSSTPRLAGTVRSPARAAPA